MKSISFEGLCRIAYIKGWSAIKSFGSLSCKSTNADFEMRTKADAAAASVPFSSTSENKQENVISITSISHGATR